MSALDRARGLIGVPWVHQGRNPAVGLDCVGLLAVAFAGTRYADHDRADYGRDPNGDLAAGLRAAFGDPVADMQAGDVVLIRYASDRHVALVGDFDYGEGPVLTLIHTDSHLGRVTEHRIDSKWARRIALVLRPEADA